MRFFKTKKASLEMSIKTIVVVVLALTMMGLGLGFIRSMIGDISETTTTVQDQIKQQILEDLRRGDKKLSFPTSEVQIEHGDSKVLAIGIKNTDAESIEFNIELDDVTDGNALTINSGGESDAGKFIWDSANQQLGVNEANVYPIKFTAGNSQGTYIIKITIRTGSEEYASKSFFITVT